MTGTDQARPPRPSREVPDPDLVERLRHAVQFALPLDASLSVAGAGGDEVLRLGKPRTVHFPGKPTDLDAADHDLIAELEHLRTVEDIRFLLIPRSSSAWLEEHGPLREHISASYRLVLDEPECGLLFALQEVDDPSAGSRELDGLPLPPLEMMRLTAGLFHLRGEAVARQFLVQGEKAAKWITEALGRHSRTMDSFGSVLDFGCGCGRVVRQWKSIEGPEFHGSDLNDYLIGWASSNLSFAEFIVNDDVPPLAYEDESFDLIYALSVFTHFVEPVQRQWIAEMGRVMRPGGVLMITTHGPMNITNLDEGALREFEAAGGRQKFDAGELVVMRPELAGTNACAAFHPEGYVREILAPAGGMRIIDYLPRGATDAAQDVFVLTKER